ncbi:MAG TPA: DUF1223 domain-containing protein [Chitinophagaceae bacterium]|jgi:hypothetical protein|nr:DUF1223 domain-containing protein [Chitinophagaceae bacterium]
MKWILVVIFLGLTVFEVDKKINSARKHHSKKSFHSFAILELFTSEGCSSCPPADRLLPQLASADVSIIPLSFHVDYWDRYGWKDPFSNASFTARQRDYAKQFKLESIYTPQLVINGEYELVGSNKSAAEADIRKILKENAPLQLIIDEVKKESDKLSVSCYLKGDFQNCDVFAAVVQKHAEVNVEAGENSGAKLSHTNVVRSFLKLSPEDKINFQVSVPVELTDDNSSANKQNWQLIIYAQRRDDLKVTGAALYNP